MSFWEWRLGRASIPGEGPQGRAQQPGILLLLLAGEPCWGPQNKGGLSEPHGAVSRR